MGERREAVGGAKRDVAQGTRRTCCIARPARTPPCSAQGFCGCSDAEARFSRVVYATRGCVCATSNLSLYCSRKRTGTVDTQVSPFINSNLGEMQELQILRQSLGRTSAPLQPVLPRLVLASATRQNFLLPTGLTHGKATLPPGFSRDAFLARL